MRLCQQLEDIYSGQTGKRCRCYMVAFNCLYFNEELGAFPSHIAKSLTVRRICLAHSIPSILILVHSIG